MKHLRVILLAWLTVLAGCGESSQERLAKSPEVQRRLKEIAEKNRVIEQKHQRMIDDARREAPATEALLEEPPVPSSESALPDSTPPDGQPATPSAQPPEVHRPLISPRLAAWRRLRAGLDRKIIRRLLGAPTVTKRDAFLEYWYYGQGPGAGKVSFVIHSGETLGWDPPLQP